MKKLQNPPSTNYCHTLGFLVIKSQLVLQFIAHFIWLLLCTFYFYDNKVQDTVSDKTIGKMRLQFWRNALDDIYKVGSYSTQNRLSTTRSIR